MENIFDKSKTTRAQPFIVFITILILMIQQKHIFELCVFAFDLVAQLNYVHTPLTLSGKE